MDMINVGYNSVTWGREQLGIFAAGRRLAGSSHLHRSLTEEGLKMMSGSTTDGNVLQTEFRKIGTDLRPVTQAAGWQGRTSC